MVRGRIAQGTPATNPVLVSILAGADKVQATADRLAARYGSAPRSQAEFDRLYNTPGDVVQGIVNACLA
jgi:hypothetical protein